jgi:GNAT superfamily N-acetyltransferase
MNSPALQSLQLDIDWVSQALSLSEEAGWNQTAEDWAVFLRHGYVRGLCAGDRLVATAAAIPYGPALGWVSMVLVTADWRRKGLASRLVADCTAFLRNSGRAALLDAAPAATAIYAALGYAPLAAMERWQGFGQGAACKTSSVDWNLDIAAFGADRRFLFEDFIARPGVGAFESAHGFALLRQGAKTAQIGPLVAPCEEAPSLLEQAVQAASGPVVIDVLDAGVFLLPRLEQLGFQRLRPFTRMALGISSLPGVPSRVMAAAGPEFG